MKVYNKFVESKKEPQNKNDIWFDGEVFNIYKEGKWQAFTLELDAATTVKKIIDNASNVYQEKLTAGKGVIIENNTISTEKFFQIVDKLPTKGEHNTIYLITSKNKEDENTLIEYIWLDNRWEELGEFKAGVDLSPYVTKEEFQETFDELGSFLNEGFTELSEGIGKKADKDGVYSELTAGDLAGRGESVPAEFGFRASGGKSIKDGRAYIKRIKGNSVVWNQGFKRGESGAGTWDGNILTINGAYSTDENTYDIEAYNAEYVAPIANHKYYVSIEIISGTIVGNLVYVIYPARPYTRVTLNESTKVYQGIISNLNAANLYWFVRTKSSGSEFTNVKVRHIVYDLTQMFGAGNEPSTIEDFNARMATLCIEDMNAYNAGEVIHCNTESIKSVGDNAWDEEWEVGSIGDNNGDLISSSSTIRSKNYIKAIGGNEYYFGYFGNVVTWGRVHYYDAEKKWIGSIAKTLNGASFIPPLNCAYMKFRMADGYGTTYNHDITLSLYHSGWKAEVDNTYKPYWQDTLPLPIIRKYFPDGMKKAGSAHDEIRYNKTTNKWEYSKGRMKEVDMGTLNWRAVGTTQGGTRFKASVSDIKSVAQATDQGNILCAKYDTITADGTYFKNKGIAVEKSKEVSIYDEAYTDAATVKDAMQGVILYYESNDWEWVELDAEYQNFRDFYNVADFGTEMSQSSVPSAPFSADIIYQFNAVDMIREHELEINELQSTIATMQAQLTSLINS